MFDKFNQKARRAIFFARWEAGEFGGSAIESEHLLLGLLHEDKDLIGRVNAPTEQIREYIRERRPLAKKVPTAQDMPFSEECIRILKYAENELDRLSLH